MKKYTWTIFVIIEKGITLGFEASNNEAKYEALIHGIEMAPTLRVTKLKVYVSNAT